MNREEAEKVLNAIDFKDGDNIVIINKNVYDKMKNEKQQLISFLKDRINYYGIFTTASKALQEVLAFVNKGGKE